MKKVAKKKSASTGERRMTVSELTIRKAAARLIAQGALVSTEIQYIQRELGVSATQTEIDAKVIEVRQLPWSSIALAD